MDENAASSETPWLAQLEERVAAAVAEIGRLRQENRRLERELQRLRRTASTAGAEGAVAWEREKGEVKARVEKLAHRLEELLGEAAAAGVVPAGAPPAAPRATAAGARTARAERKPEPAPPLETPARGGGEDAGAAAEDEAPVLPRQRTLEPVD